MKDLSAEFEEICSMITPEAKRFGDLMWDISERVYGLMQARGLDNKTLAKQIGCRPSDVAKWICGSHNFTVEEIAKLSAFFNDPIVNVEQSKHEQRGIETQRIDFQNSTGNPD